MLKPYYKLRILSIFLVLVFFQNCTEPTPTRNEASTEPSQNETLSQTREPRLSFENNDNTFQDNQSTPPVFSRIQRSGSNDDEKAFSLLQTSDGGFVTTGYIQSDLTDNSTRDILFKKFNKNGEHEYSVKIGDGSEQVAYKVVESADFYLIAGFSRMVTSASDNGSLDVSLVKVDKDNGEIIDAFVYDSRNSENLIDMIAVRDGSGDYSFVAVGSSYDHTTDSKSALILKFDMDLNLVWQKKLGNNSDRFILVSLIHIPGRGYYAAGFRQNITNNNNDSLIVHFSWAGELIDARLSDATHHDGIRDLAHTGTDIVAVGYSHAHEKQGAIHHFDYGLNLKTTHFVGVDGQFEFFSDVNTHPDQSLILAGVVQDSTSKNNHIIAKISKDFNIDYQKAFGTAENDFNLFHPLLLRRDMGLAFIGNNDNPNGIMGGTRTLSPTLYLLDQYGNGPEDCITDKQTSTPLNVSQNLNFQMSPVNLTVSSLSLSKFPLDDFDQSDISINQTISCQSGK